MTVFGFVEGSFLVSRTGDAHERYVPNIKWWWDLGHNSVNIYIKQKWNQDNRDITDFV